MTDIGVEKQSPRKVLLKGNISNQSKWIFTHVISTGGQLVC